MKLRTLRFTKEVPLDSDFKETRRFLVLRLWIPPRILRNGTRNRRSNTC